MIKMNLRGLQQMQSTLKKIQQEWPSLVKSALYEEAQIEMKEMKRRTPVDTGELRDSGMVHQPVSTEKKISVALSFGAEHAPYVHENLEAFHPVGQAKFMESVLMESAPFMAERIARRLRF